MIRRALLALVWTSAVFGQAPPAEFTYKVVRSFPHDTSAFTQGLEFRDGFLYEGTGRNGESKLRKVRLEDGRVLQQISLADQHFGEGITILNGEILQLTYRSQIGFVYGFTDFRVRRRFSYKGEGWGLANDGRQVYMSDGSAEIRVLHPKTFAEQRRLRVRDRGRAVTELNELEGMDGEIFANVWHTDRIARISPRTGAVTGWIDLAGLLSPMIRRDAEAVLNGIAYDSAGKRLFVTGKWWPSVFEIQVVRKGAR